MFFDENRLMGRYCRKSEETLIIHISMMIQIMGLCLAICVPLGVMSLDTAITGVLSLVALGAMLKPTFFGSLVLLGCLGTFVIKSAFEHHSILNGMLDHLLCILFIYALVVVWFIRTMKEWKQGGYQYRLLEALGKYPLKITKVKPAGKISLLAYTVIMTVLFVNEYAPYTDGIATFFLAVNQALLITSIITLFFTGEEFILAGLLYQASEIAILVLLACLDSSYISVYNDIGAHILIMMGFLPLMVMWRNLRYNSGQCLGFTL